jgi:3-oxoadipate enol-lactonase
MKANVDGVELSYEVKGTEGAPWLVFSHSLACSLRMWDAQVAAFQDRYRVLAYDLRGHGASAAPAGPYSMEQLAGDLKGLLDALGIRRTHFVGLSIGGAIGQCFALRYPGVFAGLVLADTNSAQTPQTLAQWEERIRIAESKGLAPLVEPTLERWFTAPFRAGRPEVIARIRALVASTPVAGYVGCGRAIMGMNLTARLKEIRGPVLAIAGESDVALPGTRLIHENIPGSKLVVLREAAHLSNLEQPEAFNRALAEFLSSLPSA